MSDGTKDFSMVEVVNREYGRWLALHDYAMIIGHGTVVDVNSKTIDVSLIIRNKDKGE